MSDLGNAVANQVPVRSVRFVLPAASIRTPLYEAFAIVLLAAFLLSVAIWNGFPIIFYDTGAYMLQGLGHVFLAERSQVYSLFLAAVGGRQSLWLVAVAQSIVMAFVMTQFARAQRPALSLWALLAVGSLVVLTTGLPWYAGQIEPDCFVAVVPLALYLFAFQGARVGAWRLAILFAMAVFAMASHPSHIALAATLLAVLVGLRLAPMQWIGNVPRPRIILGLASLALAIIAVIACNYAFTQQVFLSRSGAIFLEARMMEDGLIAPVLEATCPQSGYRSCAYKDQLPSRADAWLWEERRSPFRKLGGFREMGPEATALVGESLTRLPIENVLAAVKDTVLQFFWFQTGDGIVPQEWVLNREFKIAIPHQVLDYDHAYQQEGAIWFLPVNLVHVPVALLSLLGLYRMLSGAYRRRTAGAGLLPAFILVALLGNAFVCGVFSGPHGRYQSRIMWLPTFTVLLLAWPRIEREARSRFAAPDDRG